MCNDPVFVRSLTIAEGQQIQRILRRGRDPVARRRAEIVLCSEQGDTAGEIAKRLHFTPWYVRQVIHAFNERGLKSLKAQYENGGRPPKVSPEHRSSPVGFPFWSVALMDMIIIPGDPFLEPSFPAV